MATRGAWLAGAAMMAACGGGGSIGPDPAARGDGRADGGFELAEVPREDAGPARPGHSGADAGADGAAAPGPRSHAEQCRTGALAEHAFPGRTAAQLARVAVLQHAPNLPAGYTHIVMSSPIVRDGAIALRCAEDAVITFVEPASWE